MSRDELAVMDGSKCILQLRGVRPFLSDKFDITRHKRYRMLSDADPKNAFHIERYLEHRLRMIPNETYEIYEFSGDIDAADAEEEPQEEAPSDTISPSDELISTEQQP